MDKRLSIDLTAPNPTSLHSTSQHGTSRHGTTQHNTMSDLPLAKSESTAPVVPADVSAAALEAAIGLGDFSRLTPTDRLKYVAAICETVGLNPLTKPFDFITLQGKLTLYANKGCAEQLRKLHGVSVEIVERRREEGCLLVHARAVDKHGRKDESLGVVALPENARGDVLANAMMKAETKAKRRVTLSICGLGMVDESEVGDAGHVTPAEVLSAPTAADTARQLNDAITAPAAGDDRGPLLDQIKAALRERAPENDVAAARQRAEMMQQAFGVRSWTVVASLPTDRLASGLEVLRNPPPTIDIQAESSKVVPMPEPAATAQPEPTTTAAAPKPDQLSEDLTSKLTAALGADNLGKAVAWMVKNNWLKPEHVQEENPLRNVSEVNCMKVLNAVPRFLRAIGGAK